jgi:hypothetical protein
MRGGRRQGAIPYSRNFCWVKNRVRARNMIGNIKRALRSGNCRRAQQILERNDARAALACASDSTFKRLERMVGNCKER